MNSFSYIEPNLDCLLVSFNYWDFPCTYPGKSRHSLELCNQHIGGLPDLGGRRSYRGEEKGTFHFGIGYFHNDAFTHEIHYSQKTFIGKR